MSTSLQDKFANCAAALEEATAATSSAAASFVAVSDLLDTANATSSCSAAASDDEEETAEEEGSITTNCTMTYHTPYTGKSTQGTCQTTSPLPKVKSTPGCCRLMSILRISNWKKKYANCLLALMLVLCSLWQVQEVLVKFIEGSTTTTLEKLHNNHLPLPKVALCMQERYNYGVLAAMGLPNDYFSENRHRTELDMERPFLDLNQTWLNATWSREDVQMAVAIGATHTGATFSNNTEGNIFQYHIIISSTMNRA